MDLDLDPGGQYQWRDDGEFHLFNPNTIHKLQQAVQNGDAQAFKEFYGSEQPGAELLHPARLVRIQVCLESQFRSTKSSRLRALCGGLSRGR